jgi:flagellar basal-body rod protein FlgG
MIRGLYTAAAGMVAAMRRMELVTNDLANAQTPGYKGDRSAAASYFEQLVARVQNGEVLEEIGPLALADVAVGPELDLSQGALQTTNRDLDFALAGPGFFSVQTPDGLRFTRDGGFTRDAQGRLLTASGHYVLGTDGQPLVVPPGKLSASPDGTLLVDDAPVGRLGIVEFGADVELVRQGDNTFTTRDPAVAPEPSSRTSLAQGQIEGSNVDLAATISASLQLQRAYEASQRMIQSQDSLTAQAVNEIAQPVS